MGGTSHTLKSEGHICGYSLFFVSWKHRSSITQQHRLYHAQIIQRKQSTSGVVFCLSIVSEAVV